MKNQKENLIKVAIIGPLDSCERIEYVIDKYFKNMVCEKYIVTELGKAYLEVEKAIKVAQGIIFTGIGVYMRTLEKMDVNIPSIYIPHLAASIMKPIIELKDLYPNCTKISIDSIRDREEVLDIFKEVGLSNLEIEIREYSNEVTEKEYLEFHKKVQEKDKNAVAIIGLGWVYNESKRIGLNALRLYPIISTIKYAINELLQKMEFETAKGIAIAVQILKIKNEMDGDQYKYIGLKGRVEQELVDYLKEIQGSIFNTGWNEYIIYTTSGSLGNEENKEILKRKLSILEKEKIYLAIGNGYGETANRSEINARKALKKSLEHEKSTIYEVDNLKVRGPLFSLTEMEYEYVVNSESIEKISQELKMNPLYIKKIEGIIKKEKKREFTSDELGMYLNISVRSANRIIKKMIEFGYAERIKGEFEKTIGRPKERVYINI